MSHVPNNVFSTHINPPDSKALRLAIENLKRHLGVDGKFIEAPLHQLFDADISLRNRIVALGQSKWLAGYLQRLQHFLKETGIVLELEDTNPLFVLDAPWAEKVIRACAAREPLAYTKEPHQRLVELVGQDWADVYGLKNIPEIYTNPPKPLPVKSPADATTSTEPLSDTDQPHKPLPHFDTVTNPPDHTLLKQTLTTLNASVKNGSSLLHFHITSRLAASPSVLARLKQIGILEKQYPEYFVKLEWFLGMTGAALITTSVPLSFSFTSDAITTVKQFPVLHVLDRKRFDQVIEACRRRQPIVYDMHPLQRIRQLVPSDKQDLIKVSMLPKNLVGDGLKALRGSSLTAEAYRAAIDEKFPGHSAAEEHAEVVETPVEPAAAEPAVLPTSTVAEPPVVDATPIAETPTTIVQEEAPAIVPLERDQTSTVVTPVMPDTTEAPVIPPQPESPVAEPHSADAATTTIPQPSALTHEQLQQWLFAMRDVAERAIRQLPESAINSSALSDLMAQFQDRAKALQNSIHLLNEQRENAEVENAAVRNEMKALGIMRKGAHVTDWPRIDTRIDRLVKQQDAINAYLDEMATIRDSVDAQLKDSTQKLKALRMTQTLLSEPQRIVIPDHPRMPDYPVFTDEDTESFDIVTPDLTEVEHAQLEESDFDDTEDEDLLLEQDFPESESPSPTEASLPSPLITTDQPELLRQRILASVQLSPAKRPSAISIANALWKMGFLGTDSLNRGPVFTMMDQLCKEPNPFLLYSGAVGAVKIYKRLRTVSSSEIDLVFSASEQEKLRQMLIPVRVKKTM